jgi:RNA-binding protein
MKYAHSVRLSVFSYEKNNDELVLSKLLSLIPFPKDKIDLKQKKADGFNKKSIAVFQVTVSRQRQINELLESLMGKLDKDQKKVILSGNRLDDNLDFFLRFDKTEYLDKNKLKVTDSGNCFHVKIGVASFPKKRELALEKIKRLVN